MYCKQYIYTILYIYTIYSGVNSSKLLEIETYSIIPYMYTW